MKLNRASLLILMMLLAMTASCGLLTSTSDVQLEGDSAFDYMRTDRSVAPSTDVESIKSIMSWAEDDYIQKKMKASGGMNAKLASGQADLPEAVFGMLKKTTLSRKDIDTDSFDRIDFTQFGEPTEKERQEAKLMAETCGGINVDSLQDEFYVDHLEAIPVRNQGRRGTCAAFTGVGHLEYAALKTYSSLPTLDLSEQRFYYTSKPECQSNGCTLDEQGSWYGSGMEYSMEAGSPDIPLEVDCPYNGALGDNDLQTPQRPTCSFGALQVKEIDYVTGAKEIIDALHKTKMPVPFASPLSENWEFNKGLITDEESDRVGDTSHAAGHAYLIVGYRKLKNMDDECGVCFVIKNSWGTGWGVNGYSCMTLKWMLNWTFGRQLSHPMAMSVLLRDDLQEAEELPNNDDVEDDTDNTVNTDGDVDDGGTDDTSDDKLDNLPDPDPTPELTWTATKLFGPDETYYKAETATLEGKFYVRAIFKKDAGYSNALSLGLDGKKLLYDGDEVGRTEIGSMYLCSGEYDLICSLRFNAAKNRLFVQFTYPENRKVKDEDLPKGKWLDFGIPVGDQEVQIYNPSDLSWTVTNAKAFARIKKSDGSTSDPMRLGVDGTDINVMGVPIGSFDLSNPALCSGPFEDACGIFSSGKDLKVLPSW